MVHKKKKKKKECQKKRFSLELCTWFWHYVTMGRETFRLPLFHCDVEDMAKRGGMGRGTLESGLWRWGGTGVLCVCAQTQGTPSTRTSKHRDTEPNRMRKNSPRHEKTEKLFSEARSLPEFKTNKQTKKTSFVFCIAKWYPSPCALRLKEIDV